MFFIKRGNCVFQASEKMTQGRKKTGHLLFCVVMTLSDHKKQKTEFEQRNLADSSFMTYHQALYAIFADWDLKVENLLYFPSE